MGNFEEEESGKSFRCPDGRKLSGWSRGINRQPEWMNSGWRSLLLYIIIEQTLLRATASHLFANGGISGFIRVSKVLKYVAFYDKKIYFMIRSLAG
ncbi:MAG: hypothetical protein LUC83_08855 [Clostridiales bacterium]|nr:hypothetical protein [Clostridiales bacterium]